MAAKLNTLLGSAASRLEGLVLLQQTIKASSAEALQDNAGSWSSSLSTILQSPGPSNIRKMAYVCSSELLKHGVHLQEVNRELSSSLVPVILQAFLDASQEEVQAGMVAVFSCLQLAGGPCAAFKGKLQGKLLSLLESGNFRLSEQASECLSLLPCVGGAGSQGVKHVEAWSGLVDNLLASLDEALHLLLGTEEGTEESTERAGFALPAIEASSTDVQKLAGARASSLLRLASNLLRVNLRQLVTVPAKALLDTVIQSLSVNPRYLLRRDTTENRLLASVLPPVHSAALHLLTSLITRCGSNMLLYTPAINKIFLQTLDWTREDAPFAGAPKPHGATRELTYKTLVHWLHVTGQSACLNHDLDTLIDHIMWDVIPASDDLKLCSSGSRKTWENNSRGKKHKRDRLAGYSTVDVSNAARARADVTVNARTCVAALDALVALLQTYNTSPLSDDSLYRTVHRKLITLSDQLHQPTLPPPYPWAACRLGVYRCLATLNVTSCPARIQKVMAALQRGCGDEDEEVSKFCHHASLHCESLIHPRLPTLGTEFPLTQPTSFGFVNSPTEATGDFTPVAIHLPPNGDRGGFMDTGERHEEGVDRSARREGGERKSGDSEMRDLGESSRSVEKGKGDKRSGLREEEDVEEDGKSGGNSEMGEVEEVSSDEGERQKRKRGGEKRSKAPSSSDQVLLIEDSSGSESGDAVEVIALDEEEGEEEGDPGPSKKRKRSDLQGNVASSPPRDILQSTPLDDAAQSSDGSDEATNQMLADFMAVGPD